MAKRLWRNEPGMKGEGKYLVLRRDGTVPEWDWFVLGAKDPNAPAALRAYAKAGLENGLDTAFVDDVWRLADEFDAYREAHGEGDPDAPKHRTDDPAIIAQMRRAKGIPNGP